MCDSKKAFNPGQCPGFFLRVCAAPGARTIPRMGWIDTHCHLDAAEFDADRLAVRQTARDKGISYCIIPSVHRANFDAVRVLAHETGDCYALGIHPLYVHGMVPGDLERLEEALSRHQDDPRLVAVGEIGLDFFVPELAREPLASRQREVYRAQLRLARRFGLPVLLHVRRSVDEVLKGLRELPPPSGLAHAFNGSVQQARAFQERGFALGFGGACTYPRATRLRELAATLPLSALALETDAPDMPPAWRYVTAQARANGHILARNEPGDLPRIAGEIASLRGMLVPDLRDAAVSNALRVLPKLAHLVLARPAG